MPPLTPSPSQVNRFQKVIQRDYPNFIINSVKLLKSGWDNFVLEINKKYIFRFPRQKDFNLKKEINILKALQTKVTLEIPIYEFIGLSAPYVGYKKISGRPLTRKILAQLSIRQKNILVKAIANFFFEFHKNLPVSKARSLGLISANQNWRLSLIKKKVIGKLKNKKLEDFIEQSLQNYQNLDKESKLMITYNDLHGENMAFDVKAGKLQGVFDFSDVVVEDVHREFCNLFSLDKSLTLAIILKYEKLSGIKINRRLVFLQAVINTAAIVGVFMDKKTSQSYKYALRDLRDLNSLKTYQK